MTGQEPALAMICRPASYADLAPAMEAIYQGVNDFVSRHGFEGLTDAVTPEFHAFSLEVDPDGLWVAEDSGRVIGLVFSWVCGRFWFLANLFILPQYQGRGERGVFIPGERGVGLNHPR